MATKKATWDEEEMMGCMERAFDKGFEKAYDTAWDKAYDIGYKSGFEMAKEAIDDRFQSIKFKEKETAKSNIK